MAWPPDTVPTKSGFSSGANRRKSDPKPGSVPLFLSQWPAASPPSPGNGLLNGAVVSRRRAIRRFVVQQVDVATGQLLPPSPLLCIIAREGTRSGRPLSYQSNTRSNQPPLSRASSLSSCTPHFPMSSPRRFRLFRTCFSLLLLLLLFRLLFLYPFFFRIRSLGL